MKRTLSSAAVLPFISLLIAFIALTYNTWRNELTEQNRNIRTAAFIILKELSYLQLIADHAYYEQDSDRGNIVSGWGHVALIGDLSVIMPQRVLNASGELKSVWKQHASHVHQQQTSNQSITLAIGKLRAEVLTALNNLD